MSVDEYAKWTNSRVPVWKLYPCRYLENMGMRFLIDFGTDNALDIAIAKGFSAEDLQNMRK